MIWNQKTLSFSPYDPSLKELSEHQIKGFMRDCVRGLYYSMPIGCIMNYLVFFSLVH